VGGHCSCRIPPTFHPSLANRFLVFDAWTPPLTYSQPAFFGALALMLWLLIKGAMPPAAAMASSSAAGAS
jgi:hypothetical protein